MIHERIKKVRHNLNQNGLGGLLVSSPVNCFYLTEFEKPNGDFRAIQLLVLPHQTYIFTNPLYEGSVRSWRGAVEASKETTRVIVTSPKRGLTDHLQQICQENEIGVLGFEEKDLRLAEYRRLEKKLEGIKLQPADVIFANLRKIKNPEEIEKIRMAVALTDAAFSHILKIIKSGLSEKDIATEIDYFMRKNGAEESAFQTIVASGPNSAIPHHKTGDRRLENGEAVLLDFGARYQGYCADMSRTIFLGPAKRTELAAYQHVFEAQEAALKGIRLGLNGAQADGIARNYLKKHHLGQYFVHNLGHNLGLEIHESPSLGPGGKEKIEPNMVFSVEPGVYFPGKFGIRIEDLVLAQKSGLELLSQSTKNLLTIHN